MHTKTIAQLAALLRDRKVSSEELTAATLKRVASLDQRLNSFITVTPDLALSAARVADARIEKKEAGPLTGIPFAHKDIFCTRGIKTSCGSRMLDNFIAPYDATVTRKLVDAGAVMIGKTNMDEFAMGSSNETSYYGAVKNPWNPDTVPGGSSGGSAAAVAARLVPVATGTDTGGSIRQPAALCGLTGLKPTYGRVSRYGMIAFASSLDQGGPIARSAEDAAVMLGAMAGFDELDSTSVDRPVEDYTAHLADSLQGVKIGLPREYFENGLDSKVDAAIQAALDELKRLGIVAMEVSLPNARLAVPAYYVVASAECSSNLSRYDGVRFGYRCESPHDLEDLYKRSRGEGFGEEVKRRIMVGTYALSAGYYDAYYLKAQQVRRLIQNDFKSVLSEVDAIVSPTSPTVAFRLGEKLNDPVTMYLSDIYTIGVNLAGLPGLSMPAGFVDGLPVGLQIIGNFFEESRLLNVAHQYQQVTDWHTRVPPGFE
ncbi:MAG: Asp-tRNA(Asn)/Glu-tRNA(Gln) amidotransferase subunit GatA [Gammaproteobacteria bacterium]